MAHAQASRPLPGRPYPRRSLPRRWLTRLLLLAPCAMVPAAPALAQNAAVCARADRLGQTQLRVEQQYGRAVVDITRPNGAGGKVEVDYGDEAYIGQFDRTGRLRIGFALVAPKNEFEIRIAETPPLTCSLDVPEFKRLFRIVMRWRDPVLLDLHVIEPGGRLGDTGDINPARPNTNLSEGIGQMDLISGAPLDGATSETSYVVRDTKSLPSDGVFDFLLDYVTRGTKPVLPYCDDGALASAQIDLILIDRGTVTASKVGTNRVRCGEDIPEKRRLMVLRP